MYFVQQTAMKKSITTRRIRTVAYHRYHFKAVNEKVNHGLSCRSMPNKPWDGYMNARKLARRGWMDNTGTNDTNGKSSILNETGVEKTLNIDSIKVENKKIKILSDSSNEKGEKLAKIVRAAPTRSITTAMNNNRIEQNSEDSGAGSTNRSNFQSGMNINENNLNNLNSVNSINSINSTNSMNNLSNDIALLSNRTLGPLPTNSNDGSPSDGKESKSNNDSNGESQEDSTDDQSSLSIILNRATKKIARIVDTVEIEWLFGFEFVEYYNLSQQEVDGEPNSEILKKIYKVDNFEKVLTVSQEIDAAYVDTSELGKKYVSESYFELPENDIDYENESYLGIGSMFNSSQSIQFWDSTKREPLETFSYLSAICYQRWQKIIALYYLILFLTITMMMVQSIWIVVQ